MNRPIEAGVTIALQVNGEARRVAWDPRDRLSGLLREGLGLTGTKIGCHAGVCGARSVLLAGAAVSDCMCAEWLCARRFLTAM